MVDKNIFKLEGKSQEQVKEAFLEFLKIDKTKPGGYASVGSNKVCKFDAITVADNLCYIDYNKCKACGQCVFECPTGAIVAVNFSPKKVEPKKEEVTI